SALIFEEQPVGGAYSQAAVAKGIPGQAQARRKVLFIGIEQSIGNAGIAREQHSQRRVGNDARLHAGAVCIYTVVDHFVGVEQLITYASVEREAACQPHVILREEIPVVTLEEAVVGARLIEGSRAADQKIRERISCD